ncbi:hypothetical protein HPB50_016568 [Hyalomma asiaticum]|uniref:Uncharacterized protein n=1 Tax=Hyalomma asiaticum TaxID=266040 RepID=A0ACB7SZP0_HYAAI|nr:hypothetical protein HPB50_016568 [Hyalomma asiaticum]
MPLMLDPLLPEGGVARRLLSAVAAAAADPVAEETPKQGGSGGDLPPSSSTFRLRIQRRRRRCGDSYATAPRPKKTGPDRRSRRFSRSHAASIPPVPEGAA